MILNKMGHSWIGCTPTEIWTIKFQISGLKIKSLDLPRDFMAA